MSRTDLSDQGDASIENGELPEGWEHAKFEELFAHVLGGDWGRAPDAAPADWVDVKVVRGTEYRDWDENKGSTAAHRRVKPAALAKRKLAVGDLVIEISGGGPDQPVGRALLIDDNAISLSGLPLICSNFCRQVRLTSEIDPSFVLFCLRCLYARGEFNRFQNQTVNIRNLQFPEFASETLIPLPPLSEQRRIVAKVEALLARVNAARDRLARVPEILKRFRQSVLAAACSGRLTADWREKNPQLDSETEFRCVQENAQEHRRKSEPTEGADRVAENLPSDWSLGSIETLFRLLDYRGRNPKKSSNGKRLITAKNIEMGRLTDDPIEFVSEDTYATWMTRGFPRKGDIFFVTEGATMGFVAINDRDDEIALAQRTLTLQPLDKRVEARFFYYFMMSDLFRDIVKLNATGSAAVGIKGAKFRTLPVPFPTAAEQREIVRHVDAVFEIIDGVEERLADATQDARRITQSVLAQAFSGELVETEAELARREGRDYEPASVLLERIAADRAAEAKNNSKPKSKPKQTRARKPK